MSRVYHQPGFGGYHLIFSKFIKQSKTIYVTQSNVLHMTKDAMITARIDSGLKSEAKEMGINIPEAIESVLKEKTGKGEGTVVLVVKPYGIILQPMNYVVSRLNLCNDTEKYRPSDFDPNNNTFHANLHQALIQLSKRLLEDKLKIACKNKPLELKELVVLIQEHHQYFVNLVKGM